MKNSKKTGEKSTGGNMKAVHKKLRRLICMLQVMLLLMDPFAKVSAMPSNVPNAYAKSKVKSVTITDPSVSTLVLKKGKTYTLKVKVDADKKANKKVTYSTSDNRIATVSKKGKIKALKNGKATITVKSNADKKKKDSIKVIVGTPVSKLTLDKTAATLYEGESLTLNATATPKKASMKKVSFQSSDTSVATVTDSGKVTCKKEGTSTITATAEDGSKKKAVCRMTVKKKETPDKDIDDKDKDSDKDNDNNKDSDNDNDNNKDKDDNKDNDNNNDKDDNNDNDNTDNKPEDNTPCGVVWDELTEKEQVRYAAYDWLSWDLKEDNTEVTYQEFARMALAMHGDVRAKTGAPLVNGDPAELMGPNIQKKTDIIPVSDAFVILYFCAWSFDWVNADTMDNYEFPAGADVKNWRLQFSNYIWDEYYKGHENEKPYYIYWNCSAKWRGDIRSCAAFYATMTSASYSGNTIFYNTYQEKPEDFTKNLRKADAIKYLCRAYESLMERIQPEQTPVSPVFKALFDQRREAILNSETQIEATGPAYYVCAEHGDDTNDGSMEHPWKSLKRVNQWYEFENGTVIYLHRGDEFPGELSFPEGKEVTISAYGEGPKPILSGFSEIDFAQDSSKWMLEYSDESGKKIWKYPDSTQYVSNLFFNDGAEYGIRSFVVYHDDKIWKSDISDMFAAADVEFNLVRDLDDDLDFYFDGDKLVYDYLNDPEKGEHAVWMAEKDGEVMGNLYLRCDAGNPAEVYDKIRGGGYAGSITLGGGQTLDNISMRYNPYYYTKNVTIQNCEACFIGGWVNLFSDDRNAISNGDGLTTGGSNITIKNCYSHDNFDHGIHMENYYTMHGMAGSTMANLTITGNLVERCGTGIQLSNYQATEDNDMIDFENVLIEDNYVDGSVYSWGLKSREYMKYGTYGRGGIWVGLPNTTKTKNVTVRNNIFYKFASIQLLSITNHDEWKLNFDGNTYVQYPSELMGVVWNPDLKSIWHVGSDHAQELLQYLDDKNGTVIVE